MHLGLYQIPPHFDGFSKFRNDGWKNNLVVSDKCLVWYIFLSTFLILCVLMLKILLERTTKHVKSLKFLLLSPKSPLTLKFYIVPNVKLIMQKWKKFKAHMHKIKKQTKD